jgi:hypothetical protein
MFYGAANTEQSAALKGTGTDERCPQNALARARNLMKGHKSLDLK